MVESAFDRSRLSRVALVLALAAVYSVAGKLGLSLAFLHPSASPVWPPTGIAIAGLLLLGRQVWPGILLGAFLVNFLTAGSIATSLGVAVGNTLEGVIGAYLVERYCNGRRAFARPQDVFKFTLLAAVLSTTVSPTIGVTSLSLGGYASWSSYAAIWSTWWLGDAVGCLVVAPPLVLWSAGTRLRLQRRRVAEAVLLIVVFLLTAVVTFWERLPSASRNYPLSFLCIPSVLWAAFRFGQRAAATATLLMSAIAVWGTLQGLGPFVVTRPNDSLLLLQAFMGIMAVTVLTVAAVVSERERAEEELRRGQDHLEERIAQRTRDLSRVVESLRAETRERERAQEKLRQSEVDLARARVLAQIGSWSWDVARNRIMWSDELSRMFGLEPQSTLVTYESFLSMVHPDDRAMVDRVVRSSLRTGEPFGFEHRIVRPDGSVRWLHGLGQVVMSPDGPAKMHGTSQDITERKVAAAERKRLEQEILDVSNTEQQRLGQDLHDDLGQLLTGVAFMSKTLEKKLAAKSLLEAGAIAEIRVLVNQAIAKTRSLAQVLAPVSLETEGFMTAIQDLAASTEKVFNVSCVLEFNEAVAIDNYPAAMHLYRIAQEAISNAVRHGRADRIVISLHCDRDALTLSINDNGVGFPSEIEPRRGLGLRIMRYRADLLGGALEIRSTAEGTAVVCSVKGLAVHRLDRPMSDR